MTFESLKGKINVLEIVVHIGLMLVILYAMRTVLVQAILQSHANDDQKLALTGIPVLPIHDQCFVSFLL